MTPGHIDCRHPADTSCNPFTHSFISLGHHTRLGHNCYELQHPPQGIGIYSGNRMPLPTNQSIPAPVPVVGSVNNPYLATSLATHLRITPPTGNTTPTVRSLSPRGISPSKSPVRLEQQDLNDTPGESDPSASKMDLSALPKSYLEVSRGKELMSC